MYFLKSCFLDNVSLTLKSSQDQCGGYGVNGNGDNYDFIHVPKAVVAVEKLETGKRQTEYGYSDVQCGNGNICGRDTSGPGLCCKVFGFSLKIL